MKIAFIGLGNMGAPMARHLLRAGHEVTVWNRTLEKAEPLKVGRSEGGELLGEAAKDAEIVITMLADDHAVESSVLHSNTVIDNLPKGATHISMSTISVALSRRLAEEHAKRGHKYIAAPVFGRPDAAAAGKLFIAAAGDKDIIEHCRPVLESLGQKMFVLGDKPEMANVVKLSGNFLIATVIESLGEAIALARKYGIDPHAYVDFLTSSFVLGSGLQDLRRTDRRREIHAGGIQDAPGPEGCPAGALGGRGRRRSAAHRQPDPRPHADRARPRHGRPGLELNRQAGRGKRWPFVTMCYNTLATF